MTGVPNGSVPQSIFCSDQFLLRISSSSFDTCRALFGRLPRPAKRSCFALSSKTSLDELNSRSHTMDRVQPLFLKCLSSDDIINLRLSGS